MDKKYKSLSNRELRVANKKFPTVIVYLLGFVTPFFVIGALMFFGVEFPKSKAEIALSKWRIDECNETFLYINNVQVKSEPKVWFAMGIERDPNTGLLQRVGIVKGREKPEKSTEPVFVYESKGMYNMPMACYGSSGLLWRDLNFDGRFDELIDYKNKSKEINVNGQWIWGTGAKNVNTETGLFRFDPNIGKWIMIIDNSILESH